MFGFLGAIPIIGQVVLLLISVMWAVFYGTLMLLGKLVDVCPALFGMPIGLIGLPIAFVGSIFVNLMPDMGDAKGKAVKQMTVDSWPFTTSFSRFVATGVSADGAFSRVLESFAKVPIYRVVLEELASSRKP